MFTGTLVQSAAVVDNFDKQQSLMTSEELIDVVNGGCEDGRVANCRTLPLYNYTDLLPPRSDGDILQDEDCPSVHRCLILTLLKNGKFQGEAR